MAHSPSARSPAPPALNGRCHITVDGKPLCQTFLSNAVFRFDQCEHETVDSALGMVDRINDSFNGRVDVAEGPCPFAPPPALGAPR